MSIEALKEQARKHEQREEWKKALELYRRAIQQLEAEDRPDVGLHNRVGDLCVRLGDLDLATEHYEKAVDLYVDAELPNNAIAVCKKIVRNVPKRVSVYLRMGRIRGEQGFVTDTRESFLTYAERMQAAGDLDEALRALGELADLTPDDADIRTSLARQLRQHGRGREAIAQLRAAQETLLRQGDAAGAEAVLAQAREIDPAVSFADAPPPPAHAAPDRSGFGRAAPDSLDDGLGFELADIAPSEPSEEEEAEEVAAEPEAAPAFPTLEGFEITGLSDEPEVEVEVAAEPASEVEPEPLPGLDDAWPAFALEPAEEAEAVPAEEAPPLPTFADLAEEEDEEQAEPLPFLVLDDDEAPAEEAEPLPLLTPDMEADLTPEAFGETDRDARLAGGHLEPMAPMPEIDAPLIDLGPAPAPAPDDLDALIAGGDLDGAERLLRDRMAAEPSELSHRQRLVEVAFRRGDPAAQGEAYLELARCLERNGSAAQAESVYRQVLQLDPGSTAARDALTAASAPAPAAPPGVAASDDYVDLGSLIFDDEEDEKTTRFKVAFEEPTGDEQADFARMLSQFKAKIAQNVDAGDVRAHHDLGTAYKEMGLLDEAIEEFQAALRASPGHLPTFELLGQCFLDKAQPEAAARVLERALTAPVEVEDDRIGIYYYLGRAYEQTGDGGSAVAYYDRVFSLDINFMDVTERLRALR